MLKGKKNLQSTLNKKSDIPLLDGTTDSEEMLKRAKAMSLEEETGEGFAKSGNRAASLQND